MKWVSWKWNLFTLFPTSWSLGQSHETPTENVECLAMKRLLKCNITSKTKTVVFGRYSFYVFFFRRTRTAVHVPHIRPSDSRDQRFDRRSPDANVEKVSRISLRAEKSLLQPVGHSPASCQRLPSRTGVPNVQKVRVWAIKNKLCTHVRSLRPRCNFQLIFLLACARWTASICSAECLSRYHSCTCTSSHHQPLVTACAWQRALAAYKIAAALCRWSATTRLSHNQQLHPLHGCPHY